VVGARRLGARWLGRRSAGLEVLEWLRTAWCGSLICIGLTSVVMSGSSGSAGGGGSGAAGGGCGSGSGCAPPQRVARPLPPSIVSAFVEMCPRAHTETDSDTLIALYPSCKRR